MEQKQLCLRCSLEITAKTRESPSKYKNRKFCSCRCSVLYNNSKRGKAKLLRPCSACGIEFEALSRKTKYCGRICRRASLTSLPERTKGDLFNSRSNWQSARTAIRVDAERMFEGSGKERKCSTCGYQKHIEICHIRPVKDFPQEAKLKEINSTNNLVALCPNHHWELDNGRNILNSAVVA